MNVLIAIGSCHQPEAHLQWARGRLKALLGDVRFSRVLWTPDIKGSGRWYLNQLAVGDTMLPADLLQEQLKTAEAETGRSAVRITLDLDLMQYGTVRYHLHDWPRPYIQRLLPDVGY